MTEESNKFQMYSSDRDAGFDLEEAASEIVALSSSMIRSSAISSALKSLASMGIEEDLRRKGVDCRKGVLIALRGGEVCGMSQFKSGCTGPHIQLFAVKETAELSTTFAT